MFERAEALCRYVEQLNAEGLELLCEAARDISAREKYRRQGREMSVEQFDRSVKAVLSMANREVKKCVSIR